MLRKSFSFLIMALSCFSLLWLVEPNIPQAEVEALQEIATVLGAKYWEFDSNSCTIKKVGVTENPPSVATSSVNCSCDVGNGTSCHVVRITLKRFSLPGILPPQMAKLPYLKEIDLSYNYLSGTVPQEWGSLQLTTIVLLVNRFSGEIPKVLANITSLTYLCLEANQFSGTVPAELGNLTNLETLMLSSNNFTGNLPSTFAGLGNLMDFRINDNNFNGKIPDYISNWRRLTRLEMHASGLQGPIPSQISALSNILQIRISDITGSDSEQLLPMVKNMTSIRFLILRNCNLSGSIPDYIWEMPLLEWLDLSFNNLVGRIPDTISLKQLRFIFLTSNLLSGSVPDSILKDGISVDLSYNNFKWQNSQENVCQQNLNLNLNLFRSSSPINNLSRVVPCMDNFRCPHYSKCLLVNCGGEDTTVKASNHKLVYRGDSDIGGGTAKYYLTDKFWGFSSTGDYMDDNDYQNLHFTQSLQPSNLSELDSTARIAPITLTYFHYCLENGIYTVSLRFAEIDFTDDSTYNSLGKRLFNIYIQDKLVHKDYNIEVEAGGPQKAVVELYNVTVTNHMLDIRLYFAGKGTTRIPRRGIYGPLINAISVASDLGVCEVGEDTGRNLHIIVGVVCPFLVIVLSFFLIWWKCYYRRTVKRVKVTGGLELLQTGTFTLKQIEAATDCFSEANKLGEGGFGAVYKGQLADGTWIAVKQLSTASRQGNREFLNEIGMISCLQHPNLVKIYGCCTEGDELLLVYEYLENNCLARALFGAEEHRLDLDWSTRHKICVGIAKGLVFLHEESKLKIIHRDIKGTNVLLDRDLNPKISDFGLARLYEQEKTHVTTRVAGTIGYMAPEYALWGYLTYKVDVYSFGVLALEIVSGKSNTCFTPSNDSVCLLDWAGQKQRKGELMEIIDERLLDNEINLEEVENLVKVAILCTNASPSLRPTMSEVVKMFQGEMPVPDIIPQQGNYTEDIRFKAIRDLRDIARNNNGYTGYSMTENTFGTSAYTEDVFNNTPAQGTPTSESISSSLIK